MNKTHTIITIIIVVSLFSVVLVTSQSQFADIDLIKALRKIADSLQNIGNVLDKECEFEGISQSYNPSPLSPVWIEATPRVVQIPSQLSYDEVIFSDGIFLWVCGANPDLGRYCNILVNGDFCLDITEPSPPINLHDIPIECLDSFVPGNNILTLERFGGASGFISDLYLEMEVKPANC